jgi:hypothetical protein
MTGKLVVIKTVRVTPIVQTDAPAMVSNGNAVNPKWTDIAQKEDSNQTENALKKILKLYQNV